MTPPSTYTVRPNASMMRHNVRTIQFLARGLGQRHTPRIWPSAAPLASPSAAFSSSARLQRSFPAWFVRGGTSNGLVIRAEDLPPREEWSSILPAAMGSPDPQHARQLDGMGSGASSTSKIIVLHAPSRPDVDVDYTFVQVGIRDGRLDAAGNCGNMSAAVGPVAWDLGMARTASAQGEQEVTLRLFNTNTAKVLEARFKVDDAPDAQGRRVYSPRGDYVLDGVPGTGSRITMSFLDPAGAKTGKALPTGKPVDELQIGDDVVRASLMDVGNPGVFVLGADLGVAPGQATPDYVEGNAPLRAKLEAVRRAGAASMGLDPEVESVPKVVMLFPPEGSADIRCLAMSMGLAHRAVPLTLALCLGAACHFPGTLAADMVAGRGDEAGGDEAPVVSIAHPSGQVNIGTTFRDGRLESAELLRTARVLMRGEVYY